VLGANLEGDQDRGQVMGGGGAADAGPEDDQAPPLGARGRELQVTASPRRRVVVDNRPVCREQYKARNEREGGDGTSGWVK